METFSNLTDTPSLKQSKVEGAGASATATISHFSDNPIIDRFLQIVVGEGQSVRAVALRPFSGAERTVVFSLGNGSECTLVSDRDDQSFLQSWSDTARLLKNLRHIDMSPAH